MPIKFMRHAALYILGLMLNGLAYSEHFSYPSNTCPNVIPNHVLNLQEAVSIALCNNPQTREMWANIQAQAAQVGVSKSNGLPSIALNAGENRNWPNNTSATHQQSIGLSASYLLYDFGARSANLESANQLLAAANATQDSTIQNVLFAAIQAFYQTRAALVALNAAQVSEQAAQQSFAAAQARYVAGTATPADKLSAQTAYSQAMLNRITAEGTLKKSHGTLANVMGMDANTPIAVSENNGAEVPVSFSENVDRLIEQAKLHRPDLQAAAAQVKAAQANADAARASSQPTISLSATRNHLANGELHSNNAALGINVSVPIFSGYAPTYRIRSAEAQVEAKTAQLERLRLQVMLDVWNAYQNLTTVTQALQTTADLLDSATQSERTALGRYKAGLGTMLDVLNAQSALANARQQRIQAMFNWNISRADLALAIGNLDTDLLSTLSVSNQTP